MKNIAIVGAGNIGSRHIQGLKDIKFPVKIYVIDPDEKSLINARNRYINMTTSTGGKNVKEISYLRNIQQIDTDTIDLAIIATNSDVRLNVLKQLSNKVNVHNLILEKVVFGSNKEFETAADLIKSGRIKTWVNCPRRYQPLYHKLKNILANTHRLLFCVTGGEWGMASNTIHFMDTISYLKDIRRPLIKINTEGLEDIINSKRKNFLEFTGNLKIVFSDTVTLSLTSEKGLSPSTIITIISDILKIIIDETTGILFIKSTEGYGEWHQEKFRFLYQSELTSKVVEDILMTKKCNLPTFEESRRMHEYLIASFLSYLKKHGRKVKKAICPIT